MGKRLLDYSKSPQKKKSNQTGLEVLCAEMTMNGLEDWRAAFRKRKCLINYERSSLPITFPLVIYTLADSVV